MSVLTLDVEKTTIRSPGVIIPNGDGEYDIIVGGLNIYSGNGFYYKYTPKVEKILTSGSFKMKLDMGSIKSEDNHPDFSVLNNDVEKLERMVKIDELNTIAKITNIRVVKTTKLDPIFSNPIYHIVATMLPYGPRANLLTELFADPNRDLCFSVRSFSDKYTENGIVIKEQRMFVTWDRVDMPGQAVAKKSHTVANYIDMESLQETTFTAEDVEGIRTKLYEQLDSGMDLESTNAVNDLLGVFELCPNGNECIYENW